MESQADAPAAVINQRTFTSRVRPFGHGECAGGLWNHGLRDESASCILPPRSWRCKIVSRMQFWTEMKGWKLFVHLAPENVVVSTGQVEQVCQRSMVGSVGQEPRSVRECSRFAIQKETDLGGHSGE